MTCMTRAKAMIFSEWAAERRALAFTDEGWTNTCDSCDLGMLVITYTFVDGVDSPPCTS